MEKSGLLIKTLEKNYVIILKNVVHVLIPYFAVY